MLIPLERLLLRTRHVRSRADELATLRGRLRAQRGFTDEERRLALDLRRRKVEISARLASVQSCGRCAIGKPGARGAFIGGDCCSGVTEDLFAEDEVAALVAGGTRPRDLRAPTSLHAGCSFRGEHGCTLQAVDRPERCVRYICGTLKRELVASGELAELEVLVLAMRAVMEQFVALRRARLDDELLGL